MPPVKTSRPKQRAQLQTGTLVDASPAAIGRLLGDQSTAIRRLENATSGAVSSVAAASSRVTVTPTTGAVTVDVPVVSAGAAGVAPASGGGTANFLRADGAWAAPGGSGVSSLAAGSSQVSVSASTGAVTIDAVPANFTGIPESAVTSLVSDLAARALASRSIATTAPLTGGGNLTADRTLAVSTFGSGASGVVPASGGGTDKFVRADGTWAIPGASTLSDWVVGDGFDGDLTYDGSTTILGVVPAGSVYTLTRDVVGRNLTVNSGVKIKSNGFRIFASGTLTNGGSIQDNGNSATAAPVSVAGTLRSQQFYSATTAGGAGAAGGANGTSLLPYLPTAAGAGSGSGGSAGTPGSSGTAGTAGARGMGGGGGGGAGTTGQGGSNGGLGGSTTQLAATTGVGTLLEFLRGFNVGSTRIGLSGTGGGSGGNTAANSLGAGGASGGMVFVSARILAGSGSFQAKGGDGGTGTLGGGGGGGGGGGFVVLVYATNIGSCTTDVSGGTFGTGGTTATGTVGGSGAAGGSGFLIKYNLSGDGT